MRWVGLLLAFILVFGGCDYDPPDTISEPDFALVPPSDTTLFRQEVLAAAGTQADTVLQILYKYGVLDRPPSQTGGGRCIGFVGVSTTGQVAVGWYEREHPGADLNNDPPNNKSYDCVQQNAGVVPGTWLRNDGSGPGKASPPTIAAVPGNSDGGIGGCVVGSWANPSARCWGTVDSAAVLVGDYTDIIITPLFGSEEHTGSTLNAANQQALDFIVDSLSAAHPYATLWASPLDIEGNCNRLGSGGNEFTRAGVSYLRLAHLLGAGPTFVLPENLKANSCHANAQGRQVLADSLAAWLGRT